MQQCYRIKNWNDHYENNRTRELKKLMWIPIPLKLDGDGYTLIMDEHKGQKGAAVFGAFIALVELAAKCEPRGTLVRSNGTPHDDKSISRQSRIDLALIRDMLEFCLNQCKWLELIDLETGAEISHGAAEKPLYMEGMETRKEEKGNKEIYRKFAHLKLSLKDFGRLKESYSQDRIDNILNQIENYKKNTKYKSLYLTALDWLKREDKNNGGVHQSDGKIKKEYGF